MITKVEKYKTADGKLFDSLRAACDHAENVYSDSVCSLARNICYVEKYVKAIDFVESSIETFRNLVRLSDERNVCIPEEQG